MPIEISRGADNRHAHLRRDPDCNHVTLDLLRPGWRSVKFMSKKYNQANRSKEVQKTAENRRCEGLSTKG